MWFETCCREDDIIICVMFKSTWVKINHHIYYILYLYSFNRLTAGVAYIRVFIFY